MSSSSSSHETSETVPDHCPGTASEEAGKADACQGCPNQEVCASAQVSKGPDPDVEAIGRNLSKVRRKILVLSGKGGVGKSTVTAMLARGLARDKEVNVGVVDVDICGPSSPRIFGVEGEQVHQSGSGWSPIYPDENLGLVSAGFLLPGPDAAVIWRGPKKNGLIKQLLRDVDWGEAGLDYLLVDTPPGTGDEHLSLVQFLPGLDGAVVVTTPQEVALLDVRKEISFCRKVGLPVLGLVENMSGFVCPKCSFKSEEILPASSGGAAKLSADTGIPLLGRVPLDPTLGKACDSGANLFEEASPDSPVVAAYNLIISNLLARLEMKSIDESATTTT